MRKFSLLCICSLITSALFSQALFTYGTQQVSKEEFLKAFNKNNTAVTDKNAALREYLDLYINFKLKVKAARDLHIDTLANIRSDLQNFRTQIEETYLNDEKEINALVDEAFERSHKDIHIIHVFIPVSKAANAADTAKAYEGAHDAYTALTREASPAEVSEELKKRSIPANVNDIGFITVFSVPYEFENIIYRLSPGQVSTAYRSKNGYHLFKNVEEREAAGKMKVAQILIAVSPGDEEQKTRASKLADSVYKSLLAGASFSDAAKAVSNDKTTYMSGGEMPEFGTGKYEASFENKAFSLRNDGDITAPFQTSFGYHILKRLGHSAIPRDKNDTEYLFSLRQQVLQDARVSVAKEKFLEEVLKTLGYKNNIANKKALWQITDAYILDNKKISAGGLNDKSILHTFVGRPVTVSNWLTYAKNYKENPDLFHGESNEEIMKKYLSTTALEMYRKKLESYNPDFKYQLQEFKDGNLLFEIMERNVWSRASGDSTGLLRFFNQNKTKYYWKESADVIIISCTNQKVALLAAEQLRSGKSWQQIAESNSAQIQADSGRYELYQIPAKPGINLATGTVTEPLINEADSTASFVKIIRVYPAHQPRTFEEARGLVINDYQNLLEERWIQQLKKKYPVKVNDKIFQSL